MSRAGLLVIALLTVTAFASSNARAQRPRSSVSAAEVMGTFRSPFKGRFKDLANEIKILALGKGKVRVSFELLYPTMVGKERSANTGTGGGEATITGDTAVFASNEFDACRIVIKFVKPGLIKVTQEEGICGFGFNVRADGTYRKVSGKTPAFEDQ